MKDIQLIIKQKQYYLTPPNNGSNFKELFKSVAASGIGRPIATDGFAAGPWTPELLAEAISQIESNQAGVDLRTVQLWFQDNDKGISSDNIRWLARVIGCDDPIAVGEWQKELSAANLLMSAVRRKSRESNQHEPATSNIPATQSTRASLAVKSEAIFICGNSLNLAILVWGCAAALAFMAFGLGVHDITYSPAVGLNKQVGFFWSIAWMAEGFVLLPLFLINAWGILHFWKTEGRSMEFSMDASSHKNNDWAVKIGALSAAYWGVLIVCFLLIFALQWLAVYLLAFIEGPEANFIVDWATVAIIRSDIVSVPMVAAVSFLAFLYSGVIYWFYFIGLILLYTMANDFAELNSDKKMPLVERYEPTTQAIGTKIVQGIFRCSVLGILLGVCIKLNTVFLKSDSENIILWLYSDALSALAIGNYESSSVDVTALSSLTSFLLVLITTTLFFMCAGKVYSLSLIHI